MANTQDFTAMMKDMMGAFPVDTAAMEDAFKTTATLNEKLSSVAIDAATKSSEISTKWTKDTLSKMADISKAKAEPAEKKEAKPAAKKTAEKKPAAKKAPAKKAAAKKDS